MRRWQILPYLLCSFLTAASFAQNPEIKSLAAKDALIRYDHAVDEANAAWARTVKAAIGTAITDLKTARDTAMKNRNLEDANAIDAVIHQLTDRFNSLDFKPLMITVQADTDWQRTETLKPGKYSFTATGSWSNSSNGTLYGPDGRAGGVGQLQGRVGQFEFAIGATREVEVKIEGPLQLRMNDSRFDDNRGSVQVKIERVETAPPLLPQAPTHAQQ